MIEECTCSQMVKSRMAAIFVSGGSRAALESKSLDIFNYINSLVIASFFMSCAEILNSHIVRPLTKFTKKLA
jgi:hypothetical protein